MNLYTDRATAECMARALKSILTDAEKIEGLKAQIILDGNCGTGSITEFLQVEFPDSRVIAVDCDRAILTPAPGVVCANLKRLPFHDDTLGMVFTAHLYDYTLPNCAGTFQLNRVPYTTDLFSAVNDIRRCLTPGGMYVPFRDQPLRDYVRSEAEYKRTWRAVGTYIFEKA